MPKKPRKKASSRASAPKARGGFSTTLDARVEGLEPILGAVYLLTDRAYAELEGDRNKTLTVTLRPKSPAGAGDLGESFRRELAAQKLRWAVAKNNQPVREFVAEQAVLLASGKLPAEPAGAPAADQLTSDQRAEIEKLIAEVEAEIRDMNQKKTVPDPKGIKASWEEKQETRREGSA